MTRTGAAQPDNRAAEPWRVASADLCVLRRGSYVGAAEIAHVLKSMGEAATDDEVDEMILMADVDGAFPGAAASAPCRALTFYKQVTAK